MDETDSRPSSAFSPPHSSTSRSGVFIPKYVIMSSQLNPYEAGTQIKGTRGCLKTDARKKKKRQTHTNTLKEKKKKKNIKKRKVTSAQETHSLTNFPKSKHRKPVS